MCLYKKCSPPAPSYPTTEYLNKLKEMETLLKDIIFETVENSYILRSDLYDIVKETEEEPEIGEITVNKPLTTIADFVNQNYTPKK